MPRIKEVLEWQAKHYKETGEFISDYYEIKDRIIAERGPDKKEPYMFESCNQESIIRNRNGAGRWMPLTEEEIDDFFLKRFDNIERTPFAFVFRDILFGIVYIKFDYLVVDRVRRASANKYGTRNNKSKK